MTAEHRDTYLEAQVRTATPQKLRLMLIDGALRFARQAEASWAEPLSADSMEALRRCRAILAELHATVRKDQVDVARQVADLYFFLYRLVVTVQADEDRKSLQDIVRILEEERKTWQLLCEQLPEAPVAASTGPEEITAPRAVTGPHSPPGAVATGESFQLDA